ncbi:DUF4249 family protein [Marinoscillum luteum]|uniref:DUF4249 family protein n=1 Tax=Marinoscillum luteum TaxID=861051 RepID=A0ABW7NHJ0_9BACT
MKSIVYLFSILIYCFFGCEEPYELNFSGRGSETEMVISGLIHQGPGPYYVDVERSRINSTDRAVVFGAEVNLYDHLGNCEPCLSSEIGRYVCPGLIVRGVSGGAYRISVLLNDGTEILSEPDTLPMRSDVSVDIDWKEVWLTETSSLGIDTKKKILDFKMRAQIPLVEQPLFLYWTADELYQYLQKNQIYPFQPPPPCYHYGDLGLGQLELLQPTIGSELVYSREHFIQRDIDETFLRKHVFLIYQQSVSEGYFFFLRDMEELIENVGSIFDKPRGRLRGNLYYNESDLEDQVNGYLRAVYIDTMALAIYPNQIEFPVNEVCGYYNDTRCFNCENIGGTFERSRLYDQVQ